MVNQVKLIQQGVRVSRLPWSCTKARMVTGPHSTAPIFKYATARRDTSIGVCVGVL